jgi:hypothetical protein
MNRIRIGEVITKAKVGKWGSGGSGEVGENRNMISAFRYDLQIVDGAFDALCKGDLRTSIRIGKE